LFKHVLIVMTLLVTLGCSSSPSNLKTSSVNNNVHSSHVTLSHVKAYLLLGNIQKAEQLFQTIEAAQMNFQSMLALAELHAAKGSSIEAQKVFLLVLTGNQFEEPLNKSIIPASLLDYFCTQKKWPALQGYASALVANTPLDNPQNASPTVNILKNSALTQIGLCFFNEQHFDEAQKWLQQLDVTQQLAPHAYLALARMAVEQRQYPTAQQLINEYEVTKNKIDAKMLWTAFEVYRALERPEIANQIGEHLYSLFPNNEYTRNYILTVKRGERMMRRQQKAATLIQTTGLTFEKNQTVSFSEEPFHIIQKGENLYQLSKRYGVTTPELMSWNPNLFIDDISIGTKIRILPMP
jgi:Tfp pilus assembly protein PilF